ncbi:protein kinase domain-containing protein [Variovorax terrae]|uniref:non-specific serine/threonine protein kinase n=1 Tax=Variovorax terrae TaxID=2923278 RepID=A0A9X1VXG4_9BURK|nr:protein kinase [Variovorax terrae]MCJ0763844.1 protein kinase [Variovorax terrae]
MLTVLIVDDDEGVRNQAMRYLASPEIRLASASNGRLALEQAALVCPDIVICDVDMPELNGFDVLEALKADERLASAQVMMLTAQGSRNSMRLGMSLGADDYLTKPFTREELVEAVNGLIRRRGRLEVIKDTAARSGESSLRNRFAGSISGDEVALVPDVTPAPADQVLADAAVLVADIRGFTSIAEKLPSPDVARLLSTYLERASVPILAHGGQHLKLMGNGVMAVFPVDVRQPGSPSHRALEAATEMAEMAQGMADWVASTFQDARLPPFKVGIGVHCGDVALSYAGRAQGGAEATLAGEAVQIASRLENAGQALGWRIATSGAVVRAVGADARVGAASTLALRGSAAPIEVREVLGLSAPAKSGAEATLGPDGASATAFEHTLALGRQAGGGGSAGPDGGVAARLQREVREHADQAARAVKEALHDKLAELRRSEFPADAPPLRLEGYRVLRRLGVGGMSTVYLARREAHDDLVVLKVLGLDPQAEEPTGRFMRECSLLSAISHPHVVRIFNRGFSDDMAYIVMEYFENGDLRSQMKGALAPAQAVRILIQVADALAAIHRLGIVHRDLKPENLMVRANGDVVLADFGVAKQAGAAAASQPELTVKGELLGSPSYMSPEQISGEAVTPRSDLYSLGVLLYELVAGERPYNGKSLMELLSTHFKAPLPTLPAQAAALQPILDRLMAKKPAARYPSAEPLLDDLRAVARSLQPQGGDTAGGP